MKKLIPGRFRYADAHDMYALLGTKTLPSEGMPERLIHGIRVYVKPLPPKTSRFRNFQGLRVMTICECGQHLAVGRMHQHECRLAAPKPFNVGQRVAIHPASDWFMRGAKYGIVTSLRPTFAFVQLEIAGRPLTTRRARIAFDLLTAVE